MSAIRKSAVKKLHDIWAYKLVKLPPHC